MREGQAFISFIPQPDQLFTAGLDYSDEAPVIGRQWHTWSLANDPHFYFEISPARAFHTSQVSLMDYMKAKSRLWGPACISRFAISRYCQRLSSTPLRSAATLSEQLTHVEGRACTPKHTAAVTMLPQGLLCSSAGRGSLACSCLLATVVRQLVSARLYMQKAEVTSGRQRLPQSQQLGPLSAWAGLKYRAMFSLLAQDAASLTATSS